jgi:hypothetical protein
MFSIPRYRPRVGGFQLRPEQKILPNYLFIVGHRLGCTRFRSQIVSAPDLAGMNPFSRSLAGETNWFTSGDVAGKAREDVGAQRAQPSSSYSSHSTARHSAG